MRLFLTITIFGLMSFGCAQSAKKVDAKDTSKAVKASASETTKELGAKLVCDFGKDQRVIEVMQAGKGCSLMYTKNGEARSIATSKHGTAHCEKVQSRIAGTLKKNGFKCQ